MTGILKDKLVAETALHESHLTKFVILRLGWLRDGRENLAQTRFIDQQHAKITNKVNREDVGAIALKILEGGYGDEYWGQTLNPVSG